jgi:catechol 2,3-dioxygenase-like lactoylglutathione lyase family enzyme
MKSLLKVTPRLPVQNLRETIAFYANSLGFSLAKTWPDESPTFAMLERDDVGLQFHLLEGEQNGTVGNATLSIDVRDALAVFDSLGERVPIEWGPEVYWYGRREFAIRDPNGYLIIISQVTDDAPTCKEEEKE